jgi:hypothetical protein
VSRSSCRTDCRFSRQGLLRSTLTPQPLVTPRERQLRRGVTVNDPLRHPRVDLLAPRADLGGSGDHGGVRDTVGTPGCQLLRDHPAIAFTDDQIHPPTKVGNGLRDVVGHICHAVAGRHMAPAREDPNSETRRNV